MDTPGERPLIDYPCEWEYRVIGLDETAIRTAIAEVVGDQPHQVVEANRNGKYLSISLSLTVRDEAHRNAIYQALNSHPTTRMVI